MPTNKDIYDFKQSIVAALNAFDAPLELKRLVLADIYQMVEKKANELIILEGAANGNAENV